MLPHMRGGHGAGGVSGTIFSESRRATGIMPSVETIGVGRGGCDAGDLRGVSGGVERVAFHASSLPAAGASSEGRA